MMRQYGESNPVGLAVPKGGVNAYEENIRAQRSSALPCKPATQYDGQHNININMKRINQAHPSRASIVKQ